MLHRLLNYNAVLRNYFLAGVDIRQVLVELRQIPEVERWEMAWDIAHAHPELAVYTYREDYLGPQPEDLDTAHFVSAIHRASCGSSGGL